MTLFQKGSLWLISSNIISPQTLSQSLEACIDLYLITKNPFWKLEAININKLLCNRQNSDGGFGTGYSWIAGGVKHKVGLSVSSELLNLYALQEYYKIFQEQTMETNIKKGIAWIKKYSIKITSEKCAIPYDPFALNEVFINNGVSLVIRPLSEYLKDSKNDEHAFEIYKGMILFLRDELEENGKYEGKFWRYFHQDSKSIPKTEWGKIIENHHIGMQLAYHCTAQKNVPLSENFEIIKEVAKYLKSVQRKNGLIPYSPNINTNAVDVWGFAPCAMGFVESYDILKDKDYLKCAKKVVDWIVKYSWNGNYFIPVLDEEGNVKDDNYYPRSDAWVVHSIAHYMRCTGYDEELYHICKKAYLKIKENNFKGKEKFAGNIRKEIFLKTVNLIKTGKWRY